MLIMVTIDCQASILISVVNPNSNYVQLGIPFELEIVGTFDFKTTALDYQLSSSGSASAQFTGRAINELSFISLTSQQPLDNNLPYDFSSGSFHEVLLDMNYTAPGDTDDGIAPGTDVVIETIEITPTSTGTLTISISDVKAATTDLDNPDGIRFDEVTIENSSITVTVTDGILGDLEPDGDVDIDDLTIMAIQWLSSGGTPSADIVPYPSGDGIVNMEDFVPIAENWLTGVE